MHIKYEEESHTKCASKEQILNHFNAMVVANKKIPGKIIPV